jgi:hypothetical protein
LIKENRPVLTNELESYPGFRHGNQKFCFLNLGLDVEIDGVTYHLTSEFSGKSELGEVIDTIELERSQRLTA